MADHPTFEETYPRHEFSALVRLGMAIGGWLLRKLHLARAAAPTVSSAVTGEPRAGRPAGTGSH